MTTGRRTRWRTARAVALWAIGCLGCSSGTRPAVSEEVSGGGKASSPGLLPASTLARGFDTITDWSHEASSSGLLRTSTLPSLTDAQGAQLCDWANQVLGGYGRTVNCPDGPRSTDRDQAYCMSGLPSCSTLTVGDIEDCTIAQGVALCKYFTVDACAALRACALAE